MVSEASAHVSWLAIKQGITIETMVPRSRDSQTKKRMRKDRSSEEHD